MCLSQSLFYWIIYSYSSKTTANIIKTKSQSLFYWIIYSYENQPEVTISQPKGLNPYFIGLSILMLTNF